MTKSIIHELQEMAINQQESLTNLLRTALLVSTKLKSKEFEDWIRSELYGYEKDDIIPKYRKIRFHLVVCNPYHGEKTAIIADPIQEALITHRDYKNPVSEIEPLLKSTNSLQYTMPGFLQQKLGEMFRTPYEFKLLIPPAALPAICDAVRTVILDWAIRLESIGVVGDGLAFSSSEKTIAQKNQQTIIIGSYFGGVIGNVYDSEINMNLESIAPKDLVSLEKFLTSINVPTENIENLLKVIEIDNTSENITNNELEEKIKPWLGNAALKITSGAWGVAKEVTVNIVTSAIQKYMGL